jgi:cell division protein FtsA
MSKRPDKNLIVGLDIGTSKVVAIVGEVNEEGSIEVVGIGSHPSRGLKKGVVVNIESTVHSIQRAIEEAELMAGCDIHSVYTGIAGSHVRSLNSHGIVAIRSGADGRLRYSLSLYRHRGKPRSQPEFARHCCDS